MNTQFKERPILFNSDMVRAILDGRKTQTRRLINPQPIKDEVWSGGFKIVSKKITIFTKTFNRFGGSRDDDPTPCPFGKVGDRLWVRETFCWSEYACHPDECLYKSDEDYSLEERGALPWTPSIHMPRWASRINLEITGVRVERLQDISADDCKAEGIYSEIPSGTYMENGEIKCSHIELFKSLWNSINGVESWDSNPWVWVVEFKRLT